MRKLNRIFKSIIALAVILLAVISLSACTEGSHNSGAKATKQETSTQQDNYAALVAAQPAQSMPYSPTRQTVNFWTSTWGKPGKLAYVYLMGETGNLIGYYVLVGPPVSMCTAITPNYKVIQDSNDNGQMSVPAPSIDGAFYSGGECNTYYGQDAATKAYVEFTLGLGMNELLYDQPLANHPGVVNLGPTGK